VKPNVKRQKNDMADAEAICEAMTRIIRRVAQELGVASDPCPTAIGQHIR
jgi:hypothetical protein